MEKVRNFVARLGLWLLVTPVILLLVVSIISLCKESPVLGYLMVYLGVAISMILWGSS